VLLDMLVHRKIVLLNPSSWEDRNDSFYLEQYKTKRALKTVLALCFSKKRETFHHWKVFSSGTGGVCVEFDRELLLKPIRGQDGFRLSDVKYRFIKDVVSKRPPVDEWPFLKRKPFEDEGEFRIVYEDSDKEILFKAVPFELATVRRIMLSPWMPVSVAETVKSVISSIEGCEKTRIERSSLLETALWKAAVSSKQPIIRAR
jgi:hypothetical protein